MNDFTVKLDGKPKQIAHIEQFCGPWLIWPERFREYCQIVSGGWTEHTRSSSDFSLLQATQVDEDGRLTMEVGGGRIGIVELRGPMTKFGSSLSEAGSTIRVRKELNDLRLDESIDGALMLIESPGGTAAGTQELAAAVRSFAGVKPIVAFAEDVMASAAFFAASGATKIFANNNAAMVGSIGTFAVIEDASQAFSEAGVKVHVVRAGAFKGMGTPGTEVTKELLGQIQELVNGTNELFLNAVSEGRGLKGGKLKAVSDGRVFLSSDAIELGLIDGIRTLDQVITFFEEDFPMAETKQNEPQAATVKQLQEWFPNASSDFVLKCLADECTMDQAKDRWTKYVEQEFASAAKLNQDLQENDAKLRQELDELKKKKETAGADVGGSSGGKQEGAASAKDQWDQAFANELEKAKGDRFKAALAADKNNPGLREEMLAEVNA